MVLCCSNADHTKVDLVLAADGVAPGTRVNCGARAQTPTVPAVLNPKKKVWETAAPHLAVKEGVATYQGEPLTPKLTCVSLEGTIG